MKPPHDFAPWYGILQKNKGMKLCTSHLSISETEIDFGIIAAFAANSRNCDVVVEENR